MPLRRITHLEHSFYVLASGAVIIGLLYWMQAVLIPVAVAILFTFILGPVVIYVQRLGVPRWLSVLIVVGSVFLVLSGITLFFLNQVTSLGRELPEYRTLILEKVNSLREAGQDHWLDELSDFMKEVGDNFKAPGLAPLDGKSAPIPVTLETPTLTLVQGMAGTALAYLLHLGLVVLLVLFMLVQREELRNRLIRLWGNGNLNTTIKAIDDASQRISRYLLTQFLINSGYGIMTALGLFVLNVPYAFIWGFMAAVLRYIPYIGAWIAAFFPLALCLAVPGWERFGMVAAMTILLEIFVSNFVEPRMYGRSIGVSEVALLIAAVFWTWLWGPIGLVLSTPLTACLMVIGRYVPAFEQLFLLLGDQPALDNATVYYQRLVARDPDEASELLEKYLLNNPAEQVHDEIFVPALMLAKTHKERGRLSRKDHAFVVGATKELFYDVVLPNHWENRIPHATEVPSRRRTVVLGFACRDTTELLGLRMLKALVLPEANQFLIAPPKALNGRSLARLQGREPEVVFLAAFATQGLATTRGMCKRLHAKFPKAKLLVGCWGVTNDLVRQQLQAAGADAVATTFAEAVNLLRTHLEAVPVAVIRSTILDHGLEGMKVS